jgi:hypothetical protein
MELGKSSLALMTLLAISPAAHAAETTVYGQGGLFGLGVGLTHGDFEGRSYYLHAGAMPAIDYMVEHYTAGIQQRLGTSFYGRLGAGYARAHTRSNTRPGAPAVEVGLGNEWRWDNGFLLGAEWLNAGVSRRGSGDVGGWIGLPQLRMGVVF